MFVSLTFDINDSFSFVSICSFIDIVAIVVVVVFLF